MDIPLGILKVDNVWINIYTEQELIFEPAVWENRTQSASGSTAILNPSAQVRFRIETASRDRCY